MDPPPPSFHGYPPPPSPLRPVRGLALFAMITLACHALVMVVAAAIDLWYASLVDRIIVDLDSVSAEEIETGDLVYGLSGIFEILAYVITATAFVMWLYRVRTNAEILLPDGHRRSRPWVIFGWLVPIISFWFPKQRLPGLLTTASRRAGPPVCPRLDGVIEHRHHPAERNNVSRDQSRQRLRRRVDRYLPAHGQREDRWPGTVGPRIPHAEPTPTRTAEPEPTTVPSGTSWPPAGTRP